MPPIVRSVATKELAQQLDRPVSIQKIRINPFTFSATIDGFLIREKNGDPFIAWDEVYVNFQLASFFGHPWVFKEISVTKPYVHAQMNKDYTFNFSDLISKFATNFTTLNAKENSRPLAVQVERLRINEARASLADFTPHEPFRRVVGPLTITLDNFCTDADHKNPYSFTGTTDAGERLAWRGEFYLNPLRLRGAMTVDRLVLNKYSALYQDLTRFEIRDGVAGFHVNYELDLDPNHPVMVARNAAFKLQGLKIAEPGSPNSIMEVPFFTVTGAGVDLENRRANVDSVLSDGSKLFLKRSHDSLINVVELSKPEESLTNAPGGVLFLLHSVTNAVAKLLNSTNQWQATIHNVISKNGSLHFEDDVNSRPATADMTDITLAAKNISNLPGKDFVSNLSLRWNGEGSVKTRTVASFSPPTFEVQVDVDRVNLDSLDPYLEPKLDLLILGSKLAVHGNVHLRTPRGQLPEVSFHGDASLEDFRTVDGFVGEDLLKWDSVHVNGIAANLRPLTVNIKQVAVNNAYARLVIETNATINILNALRLTDKTAVATNKLKINLALKKTAVSDSFMPQVAIGEIVITNTTASFTDRSLKPNVTLAIKEINGTLAGLSSEELQHADLDLDAKVDGVGPARITGHLNPFSHQMTNDVKISLQDMDLMPTGPYVVKYAGYRLAEGKLNLDLDYQLIGREITSKNLITLDQFTFGEKTPGPDATHLPVRLGVAILKDRSGKIILDVPVEGSLDDPKFRISKVVWRAIVNILEKAATSPFSLVGAIFGGGGEELGYQDFAPGSAELSTVDTRKLDSLAKAMYARPGLQMEIAGSISPDGDREGLQRLALDRDIRARAWDKMRQSERATNSVDQLVLTLDLRKTWIDTLYSEALASGKITSALIAANTNLAAYAAQLSTRAKMEKGAALLMKRTPATDSSGSTNGVVY
ncbi:MAG TPA: DUF748 domain-containing protein, partial [Verrucomicrobiae bacterium]